MYKALVDNKKAVVANVNHREAHDPNLTLIVAILQMDQSIDDAREVLLKTVEGFANEPPSKEEVERSKARLLKQFDLNLNNSERIGLFLSEYEASGDWRLFFHSRDQIRKVTEQDVARVAKAYFKESNRTLGQFIPTKTPDRAEIAAAPAAGEVLKGYTGGAAIEQGEAFASTPGNIESRTVRKTLPGGLKLVMLPKKTRGGTVFAHVNLRFGDQASLSQKATIAQFTGQILIRGTKNKTRQQIQDEIDRLKARLNVGGGATGASANIETVEANLAGCLRLAAEVLREPAFPESELEPMRQLQIAAIESGKSEPTAIASLEFSRHMNPWPKDDVRYVPSFEEQVAAAKKVTLAEMKEFYQKFYGGSNGEVVVVGQFDPAQVESLAGELFGNWKSPSHYERLVNNYRKIEAIDQKFETPDKQNSLILLGMRLKMHDEDPDYAAMVLANYILGGSGGSRLFKRVRDKEGLSYGVSSSFNAPTKDDGGSFTANAICNPKNVPKVEASIRDEIARTMKEGFTAEEIALAKKSWLESRMVARAQDQALMGTLGQREFWGRNMKWDEQLEAKIAALTPEQVSEAFRKHMDPSALTVAKAGDFKKAGVLQ
jgi:zinc protease